MNKYKVSRHIRWIQTTFRNEPDATVVKQFGNGRKTNVQNLAVRLANSGLKLSVLPFSII